MTPRNGSGVNDECLFTTLSPRLGSDWRAIVDATDEPLPFFSFLLITDTPVQVATVYGELLVAGEVLLFDSAPVVQGLGTHVIPLPAAANLAGLTVYAQGVVTRSPRPKFCNGLDLRLAF